MEVVVEASGILDTPRHCNGRCPLQSQQSSQWWKSSEKQHYCCSQIRTVLDCFTAQHGSNRLLSKQEATKTEEEKKKKNGEKPPHTPEQATASIYQKPEKEKNIHKTNKPQQNTHRLTYFQGFGDRVVLGIVIRCCCCFF
jgi:hypothetical protein